MLSSLVYGFFNRLATAFGWIQDLFRTGASLAKLVGVLAALIVTGSLYSTWTFEQPDPTAEQSEGLVIILPRGTDRVRHGDVELARKTETRETLRLRVSTEVGLQDVTQDSVAFQPVGGDTIPFHVRERGDIGGRIAPLENATADRTYEVELLDTWEGGAWVEVTRTTDAKDHPLALVGLGFVALVTLLLLLRRPGIGFGIATVGLVFGIWTWKVYVPNLASVAAPQPTVRIGEVAVDEAPAEEESTEEPEEVAVEDLGLDWLTELEEDLEADGKIEEVVEKEPDEVDVEDLGLDWLTELEEDLEADGKLEDSGSEAVESTETPWQPAKAAVTPLGGFWAWLFGLMLAWLGSAGATITRREDGWDIFRTRVLLGLTGVAVIIDELFTQVDRLVAWLERATICVLLLVMAALSFLDYLRREAGLDVDVDGGPAMATLMMVWVGFLGASIATRQGQHLAVDVTDRVLSPGAAKIAKRFSAFVAAGLCWKLMQYSWSLVAEGLSYGDIAPGLPVWAFLETPINLLVRLLPVAGTPSWPLMLGGGAIAIGVLGQVNRLEARGGAAERFGAPLAEGIAALACGAAILGILPAFWDPAYDDGTILTWTPVVAGDPFPQWLGSVVIPLAFGLMAVRFFAAGVLGRFVKRGLGGEAAIGKPFRGGQRTRKDMVVAALFPGVLIGLGATLAWGKGSLILIAALLLVLVGAPLFVGIGVATLACVMLIDDLSGYYVAKDMFEATKKEELLAIPFFVLAGNIMTHGSLAERLIGVARAVAAPIPGGLGLATVFACVIFAAISGSSPVT